MNRKTTDEQCVCPACQGTGLVGCEQEERIKAAMQPIRQDERGPYEPRGLPALIEADNRNPYMGNDD